MSKPTQLCALCGAAPATTREHVPPQGIFPKPRPGNLITVPACAACNNGSSTEDEKFKAYLSLHVGIETRATEALWEKHALRTLKHNKRLANSIASSMRPVYVQAPSGIITGRATGVLWDGNAHKVVIEKLIKGLYYFHSNSVLNPKVRVKTQWLRGELKDVPSIASWSAGSVGGDAFRYKYVFAQGNLEHSLWVFCFYGKHWASGYTEP